MIDPLHRLMAEPVGKVADRDFLARLHLFPVIGQRTLPPADVARNEGNLAARGSSRSRWELVGVGISAAVRG